MAVPKQHRSKSRQGQSRMHKNITEPSLVSCAKCNKPILSHRACPFCGTYRGKEIVNVLADSNKKEQKQKDRKVARETGR
ncbi:MAG: 50S ribosomal protein L32 [bacterium]|nr:50S ribosomal protein L32 [bacterium]